MAQYDRAYFRAVLFYNDKFMKSNSDSESEEFIAELIREVEAEAFKRGLNAGSTYATAIDLGA